jgi:hypothetical protein
LYTFGVMTCHPRVSAVHRGGRREEEGGGRRREEEVMEEVEVEVEVVDITFHWLGPV